MYCTTTHHVGLYADERSGERRVEGARGADRGRAYVLKNGGDFGVGLLVQMRHGRPPSELPVAEDANLCVSWRRTLRSTPQS